MSRWLAVSLNIALMTLCANICHAATLFVDGRNTTCGDGQSWATAFKNLQDALTAARNSNGAVTEIWVAAGTYRPDRTCANPAGSGDRALSFSLVNGTALRGGFAGNEDPATFDLSTRDFEGNKTILSGDLAGNDGPGFDNNTENSAHVLKAEGVSSLTVLDGLQIAGGNANAFLEDIAGGLWLSNASPAVMNCGFVGNTAYHGGAVFATGGSPRFIGCRFEGNATIALSWGMGGAMRVAGSSAPTLINCFFESNAAGYGGAISREYGSTTMNVINCTFISNSASVSGGGLSDGGITSVVNTILWDNSPDQIKTGTSPRITVAYSCIRSGYTGTGNISTDPRLLADGVLSRFSPCIDAGDNTSIPADIVTDLAGLPRQKNDRHTSDTGNPGTPARPVADMGAYEYQDIAKPAYVRVAADPGGDGQSWATAYKYLQDALTAVQNSESVTEIWIAQGVYRPDEDSANPNGSGVRTATFRLPCRLGLYGGFPAIGGSDGDFTLRNPKAYETVLSGDLNADDGPGFANNAENSYHVVTADANSVGARLDGLIISGGNANRGREPASGISALSTSITVDRCSIIGNNSINGGGGGASFNSDTGSVVMRSMIMGNVAGSGAGIYWGSGKPPQISGCVFSNNAVISTGSGGGLYINLGNSSVRNCTFYGNSASQGSAIYTYSTSSLLNCVVWGNSGPAIYGAPAATYSCIQDGYSGTGNIDTNPLFVDADFGNLRLRAGSPCIDAGSNAGVMAGLVTDLAGHPRFWDDPATPDCRGASATCGTAPIVDMGAYEFAVVPGDMDEDLDVDADDLDIFEVCATGPSLAPAAECVQGDGDTDGDIDTTDFAILQRCWSGATIIGNPRCR